MFSKLLCKFNRHEYPDWIKYIDVEERSASRECSRECGTTQSQHIYHISKGWGCHVEFMDTKSYYPKSGYEKMTFTVWGNHPRIPMVGSLLLFECQRSWILYEFLSVERQSDPPDMFFGTVKIIGQRLKENTSA